MGEIADVQQVGADASKKYGETAALGGVGLAVGSLLGPIGALAGLAAGAMAGGKKSHVTFVCRLRDGRNFVARAPAGEFGELWALFQNQLSTSAPAQETNAVGLRSERTPGKKRTRTVSSEGAASGSQHTKVSTLPGRARAAAPRVQCEQYDKLKEQLEATTDELVRRALSPVLAYANDLHQTKWRHFDTLLDSKDLRQVIMLRIVIEQQRASFLRRQAESSRVQAEKDRAEAKALQDDPNCYSGPKGWVYPLDYYPVEERAKIEHRANLDPMTIGRLNMIDKIEGSASKHERIARAQEQEAEEREMSSGWLADASGSLGEPKDLVQFRTRCVAVFGPNVLAKMETARLPKDTALKFLRELAPVEEPAKASPRAKGSGASVKTRLADLKDFLEEGLVSEAEYIEQRRRILDSM